MKKILLTFFALCLTIVVFAQKLSPTIKEGTVISSSAFVQGQEFPLMLKIKSAVTPFAIEWTVEGYGDGTFVMTENAVAKGNRLFSPTQPSLGVTKLADDEIFGMISKEAYKTLVDKKELTLSGITFKVKPVATAMKFGDKELDVTHIVGAEGKLELWILNNEKFPLILQTSGMPTDILVVDIK
jgi:hypothetical protein